MSRVDASATKLPVELVRMITENLSCDIPELHALSLVSKTFHWEAMRLLYRSMTDHRGNTHYKFLTTLRNRPLLAELVHIYHIPTAPHLRRGALWPLILRCMLFMINLKELAYTWLFASPLTPFPQIKKGQKMPFQLETFIWEGKNSSWQIRHFHPGKTLQFLKTQHGLKRLRWMDRDDYIEGRVPLNIVPNLTALHNSGREIVGFLSGRPIADLFWEDNKDPGDEYWSFEVASSVGEACRVFDLQEFSALRAVSLPPRIWPHLRDRDGCPRISSSNTIKVLRLCSISKSELLTMMPISQLFPRLRRLVISPIIISIRTERYSESDISSLYKTSADLVYIDIRIWGSLYERWANKLLLPQAVDTPYDQVLELE